jgi:predicted SAM-dependent methyltransferase
MTIRESLWRRIPRRIKQNLQFALPACQAKSLFMHRLMLLVSPLRPFKLASFRKYRPLKLHVGCGQDKYAGWVNIDIPGSDLTIDIRDGLPFADNSVDFIYAERVLQRLTFEEGERIVKEFARCLKVGRVLRIAMPDLDYIVQKYNTDWRNQEWLSYPGYEFITTRGQMINVAFRSWGYMYLYNEQDLRNQLITAGFQQIIRCEPNRSINPELVNLETGEDLILIMEGTK